MQFKNVAVLSTAGVIAALALGAGGAYAANQIGSAGIKNDSVRSIDVKDQTLRVRDLRPGAVTRLQGKGTDTSALEARIADLEANAANGSDINTNWANGLGATIVDANTVELDSRNDDGYAFASIDNLDLPISEGAEIEFTYRLDNGAAFGWGAPRIQFYVNGVKYSSAHQVTPEYGDRERRRHLHGQGCGDVREGQQRDQEPRWDRQARLPGLRLRGQGNGHVHERGHRRAADQLQVATRRFT